MFEKLARICDPVLQQLARTAPQMRNTVLAAALGLAACKTPLRVGLIPYTYEPWTRVDANGEYVGGFLPDFYKEMAFIGGFDLTLVPLWEETFFRGFVHNWLRNRLSFWPATLISAALFGIFHLNLVQGFAAFLLGLVLAWLYEKADSLWAPITLHVTNNLIAQGLFFLMLLLQDYLPGM